MEHMGLLECVDWTEFLSDIAGDSRWDSKGNNDDRNSTSLLALHKNVSLHLTCYRMEIMEDACV